MHHSARQYWFIISRLKTVHNIGPPSGQQNFYYSALRGPDNSDGIITNVSTSHSGAQCVNSEIKTNFLDNRNWAGNLESGLTKTKNVPRAARSGTLPFVHRAGDVGQVPVLHRAVEAHVNILK